jgi:hypothetical protein
MKWYFNLNARCEARFKLKELAFAGLEKPESEVDDSTKIGSLYQWGENLRYTRTESADVAPVGSSFGYLGNATDSGGRAG